MAKIKENSAKFLPKFSDEILSALKGGKNLLAFSYGSDSTALFYALNAYKIGFDLALINYKKRAQSDLEEAAAKKLAGEFGKQIFTKTAPNFKNNFQNAARNFRYEFFGEICVNFGYENVILAHQMDDKFEWFLRQFARGAGLAELLGMKEREKREKFTLLRPFLRTTKAEILSFLQQNKLKFFKDESNENEKYQRNYLRKHFAAPFMSEFGEGVGRSFEYLSKDLQAFDGENGSEIAEFRGILICECSETAITRAVKKMGLVMSAGQRRELKKGGEFNDIVVSGRICIAFMRGKCLVFRHTKAEKALKIEKKILKTSEKSQKIGYENLKTKAKAQKIGDENSKINEKIQKTGGENSKTSAKIPKAQREIYRKAQIPKLLRPYLYENSIEVQDLLNFLGL